MSSRDLRIQLLFAASDRASGSMKKIKGELGEMAKAVRATSKSLDQLDKVQSDLDGFRELKRGIEGTKKELAEAAARAKQLGKELAATEKPTRQQTAEFKRAAASADALEKKYREQSQQIGTLRDRLGAAGYKTRDLGSAQRTLANQIAMTNDKLKQQKQRLADASAAIPQRIKGMERQESIKGGIRRGASAAAIAMTTASTITGVEAVTTAATFEDSMTDIAQKAALSREQAQRLGQILLSISPKIAQLPEETAAALDNLAAGGLDPRQGVQMIEPIGRAATAYKASMTDLGDATFSAIDNLKVPVSSTARVLDIMAASGKAGRFEIRDMAQYFPMLTASAQGLGQKGVPAVADLAAALQIVRKGTGDASTAANNLQNLMNKINSEETVANFKEFGINLPKALKEAAAAGKTPIEAITELTAKATKGDLSQLSRLFGDAQVQAALRPLIQNMEAYKKIRADALRANQVVDKDFVDRQQNTASKWERLKASWQSYLTQVGNAPRARGRANSTMDWLSDKLAGESAGQVARNQAETQRKAHEGAQKLQAQIKQDGALTRAQMFSIGANATLALAAGMTGNAPIAVAQASAVANRVSAAFKNKFQIKSPSRLFMGYGGYLTEGLARGLANGSSEPVRRMQELSARIRSDAWQIATPASSFAMPQPGAAASSQGAMSPQSASARSLTIGPVTVQIMQQPGEDGDALAERMVAKLRQMENSAMRSSYLDD